MPHRRRPDHRPAADRDPGDRARLPEGRLRRGQGHRPRRGEGGPADPASVPLRHGAGQLRRRLRHPRRPREPGQARLSADRSPGHPHQGALRASRRADLPARRRPGDLQHALLEGESARRQPRRRSRRLPGRRRLRAAPVPRGRVGPEAVDRPARPEVVPRLHRRLPLLRCAPPGGRRRHRRLLDSCPGRRSRGRPQGARLRPDRPDQRERGYPHGDDLRLALPEEHPPVGDDRRQPARQLPLGSEDDRRADPAVLPPLRPGQSLQQAHRRPGRLDSEGGHEHARSLLGPSARQERRPDHVVLRADGVDLRRGAAVRPDDAEHAHLRLAR